MPANISPGDDEFSFEEFEKGFVFDNFGDTYKKGDEAKPEETPVDKTEEFKPVNRIKKYFK